MIRKMIKIINKYKDSLDLLITNPPCNKLTTCDPFSGCGGFRLIIKKVFKDDIDFNWRKISGLESKCKCKISDFSLNSVISLSVFLPSVIHVLRLFCMVFGGHMYC